MPEPVKLNRERWDSLTRGIKLDEKRVVVTIRNEGCSALVTEPVEFNGITFLPATYVPADSDLKDRQRFPATALSCARA